MPRKKGKETANGTDAASPKPGRKPKKASPPQHTLRIEAEVNGRIRRATIFAHDLEGTIKATDKADLVDGAELRRSARRLAEKLKADPAAMEASLSATWAETLDRHRREEEEKAAAAAAGLPEAAPEPPCSPCSPGSQYEERAYRIYLRRHTKEAGDYLEPLANFTARIAGEDVIDDGSGEVQHVFRVEGTLHNGTPLSSTAVPAADFPGMGWVLKAWGCRANPSAGMGAKDHLRAAIQELSGNPARRVIYQHTGWRQEGDRWLYLHAGGGVGQTGKASGPCVELTGKLAHYSLPEPPSGAALGDAVRADLRLLASVPARLIYPLIGAVYRAVLGAADSSLSLVGKTGLGKSELAALAQQHYGAGMHRLNLPGSWTSTANALESLAFLAKDALLVIDDFKPGGSKGEIDAWHAKADRVLRAQGNSSARQRCRADGSVRPDRPPRGMILLTGEDMPRGESLRARNLVLQVRQGEFALSDLTPLQRDAAAGLFAQALSGFIHWLAPQYEAVRSRLPEQYAALRLEALGERNHPRTPGIVADLHLGLSTFLNFALERGAISAEEQEQHVKASWQALLEAAAEQTREILALDPAGRFLQLLAAALASGQAHIAGPSGQAPGALDEPEAWGWRLESFGAGEHAHCEWRPQGRRIGWVEGGDVYLDPDAAYAEAQRLGEVQGERLPLSQTGLNRRLKEQGQLERTEKDKTTVRVSLQGTVHAVLFLRQGLLCPQKQGEQGEQGECL